MEFDDADEVDGLELPILLMILEFDDELDA